MKGLIVANVCAIAVSALASGPCIARWELQGTTYAAVLAQLVQLAVSYTHLVGDLYTLSSPVIRERMLRTMGKASTSRL